MNQALKSALLRIGFFAAISFVTFIVSATLLRWILPDNALLVAAVFSNFSAAAASNAIALRTFEHGRLSDVGMGWTMASRRNLSLGLLGGIGAALIVLLLPVVTRVADFEPAPNQHFAWPSLLFVYSAPRLRSHRRRALISRLRVPGVSRRRGTLRRYSARSRAVRFHALQ